MVFHNNLSDSKSPQVSRTLLSILVDLNNAVVYMVSTHPLISKSSYPCTDPLVTVRSAPIKFAITVIFLFHCFFTSLTRSSSYLSFCFLSVIPCSQQDRQSPLFSRFSFSFFFFFFFVIDFLGLVVRPRFGDPFVFQNPTELCAPHFPGRILGCAYTICSYGQILNSCTIPSRSPSLPSRNLSYTLSARIYCICL